ncbi:MAG: M20/M25/M40 family metallo-hydrolase [Alphaproteobacteria bacterium]|nr:MAG: M20/M25/M40 family metallo-hydrolase [Alphaproteobacteria bacterium]
MRYAAAFFALALAAAPAAQAQTNPQAEAQALEMLKRGIAFRTVAGEGNQTFDYASYLKEQLVAGGFAADDVRIEKLDDTAFMVVRYRGTGTAAKKPIYISGHMDVVEAKPADWTRDPFTPVIENGYIWGRGASDMKYDMSTMIATLIQLKREGFTGLYKGLVPNLLRVLPQAAVTFLVYETVMRILATQVAKQDA